MHRQLTLCLRGRNKSARKNFVTEPSSGEIILSSSTQEMKESQAKLHMGHKIGKESVDGATRGNRSSEEWNI